MINEIIPVFSVFSSLFVGAFVVWLFGRASYRRLMSEFSELKARYQIQDQELAQGKVELSKLTERLHHLSDIAHQKESALADMLQARDHLAISQAELAASKQYGLSLSNQVHELSAKLESAQQRIDMMQRTLSAKEAALAELNTARAADLQAAQEKLTLLIQAKEKLSEQFQKVADEVLDNRTKQLQEQQKLSLTGLLNPLKTKLDEFQKRVETTHQEGTKDRAMLAKQVEVLTDLNRMVSQEAKNLTQALKGENKTQGVWGEIILERLLELSGLVQGREYDTQVSGVSEGVDEKNRKIRPDVILHMPPGGRHLVIDAKVSLTAFERYMNAEDEASRQVALKQHVESVRKHLDELSKKDYQSMHGLNTVDYVILFVAIEPAFLAAINHDTGLYQDAWKKHVLLVCPSTLLFVLRMVDALWRQENQKNNAEKILKMAEGLYDKFHGFYQDFESVGKKLTEASVGYEEAHKKLLTGRGNLYHRVDALVGQRLISPKKRLTRQDGYAQAEMDEVFHEPLSLEERQDMVGNQE